MKFLALPVVALVLFSCEPSFKKEYSWAYPIAGDWLMDAYYLDDMSHAAGPFEMRAYNPSFGTDSIWIDDYATTGSNGNFWSMKFKVAVNMGALTFKADSTYNSLPNYRIKVIVDNGKLIGKDSMYMEVIFADDPTTTYVLKGHRESGYDEYMGNF